MLLKEKLLFVLLFPPAKNNKYHNKIIEEILEEKVVSSRGKINYRSVKKHKSKYEKKVRGLKPPQYKPQIVLEKKFKILK